MAITKIIVIRNRLDKRVNYALNEDKTALDDVLEYATDKNRIEGEQHLYESAVNCEKENALLSMMQTKKHFEKTDKVQGYHIIQSFRPDEITPELAHQVGVEFTQKCFGKYEAVIGTHLDKNHLHNHIVVNSVSFIDGKKYRNNFKDYFGDIRGISDALCKEHGLSIIEENDKKQSVSYVEWLARNKGKTSWQTVIRNDINDCIKQAFSYGNFIMLMEHKGYEVKQGKYISFKPFGREYSSRGYKLGNEYSLEKIRDRIEDKNLSMDFVKTEQYLHQKQEFKPYPKVKRGSLKALLLHYMYLMGMIKKNQAPDKAVKVLKEDLVKFEKMTKSFDFVTKNNLDTVEDVKRLKDECYKEIKNLKYIKVDLQAEKEKNKPAFEALRIIKVFEKPYQMYLDGYHEMQDEHDSYVKAFTILNFLGYISHVEIESLEKIKSSTEEQISVNDGKIQY
ncbi:MAG: relaxase/mobilization nuclease domain-containing protein, partial [Clostridiales bacterium]|nr:relaxase/mobilization nuclease domain-containing protein [Clostridiales bacterium]